MNILLVSQATKESYDPCQCQTRDIFEICTMKTPAAAYICTLMLTIPVSLSATTRYVDLNGTNSTPPFTSWATAATNIQDAIDTAVAGDQVLAADGIYRTGGRLVSGLSTTNRVAVTNAVALQSLNGPSTTIIEGYRVPGTTNGASAIRCVYLASGASLSGFTVTNGATGAISDNGGGVYLQRPFPNSAIPIVSNCVITGNSAGNAGGGAYGNGRLLDCVITNNWGRLYGGGASGCMLVNCLLKANAAGQGGGALGGVCTNCLLINNSARISGGGAYGDTFVNCTVVSNFVTDPTGRAAGIENARLVANSIVYFNNAPVFPNYNDSPMAFSCTTPAASGAGNITNAPLFESESSEYHLQSISPCINSGNNSYISTATDLEGSPRIAGDRVDMGAYEFPSPTSILSYAWAQQYGVPTDGSADFADPDADGMINWQESIAGTDPTNSLSVLRIVAVMNNSPGWQITWQSVSNRIYYLQRCTNLATQSSFQTLQSHLVGQPGATTSTDTSATNGGPYFYRVGVQ
jgi:hypothetical protein